VLCNEDIARPKIEATLISRARF